MSIHVTEDGSHYERKKSKKKRSRNKDDLPDVASNEQLQDDSVGNDMLHQSHEQHVISTTDELHAVSTGDLTDGHKHAHKKRNRTYSESSSHAANCDGDVLSKEQHWGNTEENTATCDSDHLAQRQTDHRLEPSSGTDVPSILLNRMAEALSDTQPEPYSDTLAKFDWEKVRFASYSAEDCKRIWSKISRQVPKYKTLAELVRQAQSSKNLKVSRGVTRDPDKPKIPHSAFFRYFSEKRPSYAKRHGELTVPQMMKALSKKYKKLPPEKQQKYIDSYNADKKQYDEEMARYSVTHPSVSALHKPVTVLEYYVRRKINKKLMKSTGKVDRRRLSDKYHRQWDLLPQDKKMKTIEEAVRVEEEYQRRVKSGEQLDISSRHIVLSKSEQSLKDEADGCVKKPGNLYSLFCQKYMRRHGVAGTAAGMKDASAAWQQLSPAKKAHYQRKADKKMATYMQYIKSLPATQQRNVRKLARKNVVKFEGEPSKPPRSSYVLFVRDAMKQRKCSDFNSNTGSFKDLAQIWSKLNLQEKQQYKCLYDAEWQQYWRDLALFKQSLSQEQLVKYEAAKRPGTKPKKTKHVVDSAPPAPAVSFNGIQISADEAQVNAPETQDRHGKRKLELEHTDSESADHGMMSNGSPSQHKKKKHKG